MNAPTRQDLLEEAVRLWRPGLPRPAEFRARDAASLSFSLMFFSALAGDASDAAPYELVHRVAARADELGFPAVWLPERHFHPFGGPYPNPAVLAASLARHTLRLRLRAGSVVLPLHHPAEVAESWAMVDALSGGRVEVAFGSGWNPNDFLLAPGNFADARQILRRDVAVVRRLWRGETVEFPNGKGAATPTRVFPRPVQAELPVWISSTGSADTFAWAGEQGFDLLTMLINADLDGLARNIVRYRSARRAAGHDPAGGRVALMLHTLVHPDGERVRREVRGPFLDYVRSSLDVQRHGHADGEALTEAQREQMAAFAYERYTRTAALFGTAEECRPLLHRVAEAGVDEIACLVDFGVADELVLEGLAPLAGLAGIAVPPAPHIVATPAAAEPIAIVGMACRFPGSRDPDAFWANLRAGRELLTAPPLGRRTGLSIGGFLDDVEGFDAAGFGIAPAEAAAMDPHHRLLLETVRAALADAGHGPDLLRGSDTGVFAAMYSTGFAAARDQGSVPDAVEIAGQMASMAANRVSFAFDWRGPSEVVNTACSSGLVAVHRAAASLRAGECAVAVAGGVSLLLSAAESAALAGLGVLSPSGRCRAFDRAADGQVRGEGVGVLVLKPLAAAQRDGDTVHAVIAGSAVNHGGGRGGSLTLPNPVRQAECMRAALDRAAVAPEAISYVEAHGGGTAAGDAAELGALERVFRTPVRIGSVKANIGSLDAAGGIAAVIKTVLALRHGEVPQALHHREPPEPHASGPLRFPQATQAWGNTLGEARQALVHAYGLGGVNAALVLRDAPPDPARPQPPSPAAPPAGIVAKFYDFATRPELADMEVYLTLAPFPARVPGFSWTRTFQDPTRHAAHWALMQAAQREMRDVLFAPADLARARRVLDIGCGLGTDLIGLVERHPHLSGTGYTISPAQAGLAQRRVAARGLSDRIAIHHRDSAADAFPGEYNVVFGFEVAHHIRDKDALFANIVAHLAPGGTLVLADNLANTVAPIEFAELGAWTLDREGYADLFTRHRLRLLECVDASAEIANFLADPELEPMLADEARAADAAGRESFAAAAAVQRSWHAFGEALATGLMSYILVAADHAGSEPDLASWNSRKVASP